MLKRIKAVRENQPLPNEDPSSTTNVPSLSVEEWIGELAPNKPVAVYCAWGFDVGRNVTKTLMERGFDARFVRGGISAWYAAGGARVLNPMATRDLP